MRDGVSTPLATDRPGEEVRALRSRIDEADDSEGQHRLRLDLARALFGQDRFAEAATELETLVAVDDLAETLRAAAMGLLAGAYVLTRRPNDGLRAARSALDSPAADAETKVLALSAIRGQQFFEGRFEDAVAAARAVAQAAARAGPVARAEARLDMGGMLFHADEFAAAAEWLNTDTDWPARHRLEAAQSLAALRLQTGEWTEVLDLIEAPTGSGDADTPDVSRFSGPPLRAIALWHRDRVEDARREMPPVAVLNPPMPVAVVAHALLAEAAGDTDTVAGLVERCTSLVDVAGVAPQFRLWGPELVRLALAAGNRVSAARITRLLEELTTRTAVASVHGAAFATRGMLERDSELLFSAVEKLEGPRVVVRQQVKEALADVLRDQGRKAEAIAILHGVLDTWVLLVADRDARRAARALNVLGVRTRPPIRRASSRGWEALSVTEASVARLVGEGLTNAQIAERLMISRRTVETHVAHILAKLDVPTRATVAAQAARRAR